MTASLDIVKSGLATSLQDQGRIGFARFGVPQSGALDPVSLQLANGLLGNDPFEAALEFRVLGPTVRARGGTLRLALSGGAIGIIESTGKDPEEIAPWQSFLLEDGARLSLKMTKDGQTSYLCLQGGFDIEKQLGSCSTYARAKLGPQIEEGQSLASRKPPEDWATEKVLASPFQIDTQTLHVIMGPQADYFSKDTQEAFLSHAYRVSRERDRMGMRLEGPALSALPDKGHDIISDGLVPGAIQVPGNGQPIVLGLDCQTVGGYPKIATLIQADLVKLGRLKPDETVHFKAVDHTQARASLEQRKRDIKAALASIQDHLPQGRVDLEALYRENLIEGVINAKDPHIRNER